MLVTKSCRQKVNINLFSGVPASNGAAPQITIIYPPTVDWNMLFQRPQQLLKAFSRLEGVRSIYINNDKFKPMAQPIIEAGPNLFVVRHDIDYSHLVKGKKILWFNYPPHYTLARDYNYDLVVFDAVDNPVEELAEWATDMENAVEYSDIISCTTATLYHDHKGREKPIFLCPNAADYEHFHKAFYRLDRPPDLPVLPDGEKIIGYYGAMATWVDYELICRIADRYHVVLLGNNQYYYQDIKHPNITVIEHRDYSELPKYLSCFDAALIPFKLTGLIEGCDPIKFYEYISAGKPVIATEIKELRKRFPQITYFINYHNCHQVIQRALAEDSSYLKTLRMSVARKNTWSIRARAAIAMIKKHLRPNTTTYRICKSGVIR